MIIHCSTFYQYAKFIFLLLTCFILNSCGNDKPRSYNDNFVDHVTVPAIDTTLWTKKDSVIWAGNDPSKWPAGFGIGKAVSQSAIDKIDIDIMPDGHGLPDGKGNATEGRKLYVVKCSACHGSTGREGPNNQLVGVMGDTVKEKTIGNYWPYATTVFDYIRRAMPLNAPGSLSDKEVYHLTAYLLSENRIIDSTKTLTADNLAKIKMPAHKFFIVDDRKGGPEIK